MKRTPSCSVLFGSILLYCLAFNGSAYAAAPAKYEHKAYKGYKGETFALRPINHFEIIGAGSISKLDAGNGTLGVTSSETDRLVQTNSNSWNTPGAQLGVGYVYYFCGTRLCSDQVQWFPAIEPQLNLYYLASNSIEGDVWRFNSPDFNDLTFDIPIHSTRLMLDVALTVASWRQLSMYVKGGIGHAWTRISYSDKDKSSTSDAPCPEEGVSLSSKTSSNFVWEAGLGVVYAFNDRIGVSLEYLYTDLGTVKTASSGNTGLITAPVISPASFDITTQTALLGLHIAL